MQTNTSSKDVGRAVDVAVTQHLMSPSTHSQWPISWMGRFCNAITLIEQEHGAVFSHMTIRRTDDLIRLTITVFFKGKKLYGTVDGRSMRECLSLAGLALGDKSIKWYKSKY